jgi:hypothetical protein
VQKNYKSWPSKNNTYFSKKRTTTTSNFVIKKDKLHIIFQILSYNPKNLSKTNSMPPISFSPDFSIAAEKNINCSICYL